jgi:hypothetical protein
LRKGSEDNMTAMIVKLDGNVLAVQGGGGLESGMRRLDLKGEGGE